jgi:hypothetical protein
LAALEEAAVDAQFIAILTCDFFLNILYQFLIRLALAVLADHRLQVALLPIIALLLDQLVELHHLETFLLLGVIQDLA